MTTTDSYPALKQIFDHARLTHLADSLQAVSPPVDRQRFLALATYQLDSLSLMQRLRRTTESLHAVLPADFDEALGILRKLAPLIDSSFVTLVLPDYVGCYGAAHFDSSMQALAFFTPFGTSEFGIRPFLRDQPAATLAVMQTWSVSPDAHLRRLASEGSRPRLPWSFHLPALAADPDRVAPILDNLRQDDSLYVKKSVGNHLNDITKLHPQWVMDKLETWPRQDPHCQWIVRRALRTLIKKGDKRALALVGAGHTPRIDVEQFALSTDRVCLGDSLSLTVALRSTAETTQKLEIDYAIDYVKRDGSVGAKTFKFKVMTLGAGQRVSMTRSQTIKDFSTRTHHTGRHHVALLINGERLGEAYFDLDCSTR